MRNKVMKITFKIVMIIIVIVGSLTIYIQFSKFVYQNRVADYLTKEKNYSSDEIAYIKGVWGKKLPPFYVVVSFKDEPEVEYIYFAHNEVIPFSYRLTGKMSNKAKLETELKHYEK